MLPSLFVAHGAPTLAIEQNGYVDFLKTLAARMARPAAIVVFTAHWEHPVQQISGAGQPQMIYDFYGFPESLYRIQYPAGGHPELAGEIRRLLQAEDIPCAVDEGRGWDHGVWVPLQLMYPDAEVPVVAMSVHPLLSNRQQYQIGKVLRMLRERNVLIIGSGGTVHNLGRLRQSPQPDDWAVQFDDWLADCLHEWDLNRLFDYETWAPYAKQAVPRNEHFIPLLLAMGAADDSPTAQRLYRDYQYGSLSLSVWQFG